MNDFGWPQWTVVVTWMISFVWTSVNRLRDPKLTSGAVTATLLFLLGYYVFFAFVLRAGGFW